RLTIDLLSAELSPRQEEERIERTEQAIEDQLRLNQKLEVEGESLLAHADFIAEQIEQSKDLRRYVTGEVLRSFVLDFFARNFRGCNLAWDTPRPGCFRLQLTFEAHDSLKTFGRSQNLD